MAQIVPLNDVPSQRVQVLLNNQVCQIYVYQAQFGMFLELSVNNTLIIAGVVCENLNRIVRSAYLGFSGDLAFIDTQGSTDPVYTGIGTRYFLLYLTEDDLAA